MGLYRNEETGEIIEYYKKEDIALSLYQQGYLDRYGRRYPLSECKRFVNHVFDALCDVIRGASVDSDIYLRGFGTFKKVRRKYNTKNFSNCDGDVYATSLKFKASPFLWNLVHNDKGVSVLNGEAEIDEDIAVSGRDSSVGVEDGGNEEAGQKDE